MPCDAKVNVPDDRWGPMVNLCHLQRGHGGPHLVPLRLCEPQAWMSWVGTYCPGGGFVSGDDDHDIARCEHCGAPSLLRYCSDVCRRIDKTGIIPKGGVVSDMVDVGPAPCARCGEPLDAHDRDDIGAGLVQYTCPVLDELPSGESVSPGAETAPAVQTAWSEPDVAGISHYLGVEPPPATVLDAHTYIGPRIVPCQVLDPDAIFADEYGFRVVCVCGWQTEMFTEGILLADAATLYADHLLEVTDGTDPDGTVVP